MSSTISGTGTHTIETSNLTGTQNAISTLVIPWHDASAVYAGIYRNFNIYQHKVTTDSPVRRWLQLLDCHTDAPTSTIGVRISLDADQDVDGNGIKETSAQVTTVDEFRSWADIMVILHSAAGQDVVATDSDPAAAQFFGAWEAVFLPSLSFPFLNYRFSVLTSALNPAANSLHTGDVRQSEFVIKGAVSCSIDDHWRYIGWV